MCSGANASLTGNSLIRILRNSTGDPSDSKQIYPLRGDALCPRVTTLPFIAREIAPNMSSYLLMMFILLFGGAILIGASLDFLGLGPSTSMSLGLMMNNAFLSSALLLGTWWWFVPPGIGIIAIVGGLYVMNVGLDEIFNPKLREK